MAVFSVVAPQSVACSNLAILSTTNGTAVTTSGSAGPFPVDFFSSAEITVAVTSCSGTIAFYLQKLLPNADGVLGTVYDDISCLTSLSSSTQTKTLSFVNGGNTLNIQDSQHITANTVQTVHFGAYWRVTWVVGGSGPSHNFGIFGNFRG